MKMIPGSLTVSQGGVVTITTRWKATISIRLSSRRGQKENLKEKVRSLRETVIASSESGPQKEKEDVGELTRPREKMTLAQIQLTKVGSDEAEPEAGIGKASQKESLMKDMIVSMAVRKERKVKERTKERMDKARPRGRQAMALLRPKQPRRKAERLQLPSSRRRLRMPGR